MKFVVFSLFFFLIFKIGLLINSCFCFITFVLPKKKEEDKDLLISLLESILDIKIKELEYLNLEKNSDNINLRKKYFDLHVKTEKENIQIEVNPSVLDYTRPRNVSYICDTYSHQKL